MWNGFWKIFQRVEAFIALLGAAIASGVSLVMGLLESVPGVYIFVGVLLTAASSHYLIAAGYARLMRWNVSHRTKELVRGWLDANSYSTAIKDVPGCEWGIEATSPERVLFEISKVSKGELYLMVQLSWKFQEEILKSLENTPTEKITEIVRELRLDFNRAGILMEFYLDSETPYFRVTCAHLITESLGEPQLMRLLWQAGNNVSFVLDSFAVANQKAKDLSVANPASEQAPDTPSDPPLPTGE